jgi:F0F1-type ATP synthase membrane subunit b/b'
MGDDTGFLMGQNTRLNWDLAAAEKNANEWQQYAHRVEAQVLECQATATKAISELKKESRMLKAQVQYLLQLQGK